MTEAAQTVQALFIATLSALQAQAQPVTQAPYSLSHVANQCCVLAIVIMVGCSILAAAFYVLNEAPPQPARPNEQEPPELTEIYERIEGRESSEPFEPNVWHTVDLSDKEEKEGE